MGIIINKENQITSDNSRVNIYIALLGMAGDSEADFTHNCYDDKIFAIFSN